MKFGIKFDRNLGLSRATNRKVVDGVNAKFKGDHTVTHLFPWARSHILHVPRHSEDEERVFIRGDNHEEDVYWGQNYWIGRYGCLLY